MLSWITMMASMVINPGTPEGAGVDYLSDQLHRIAHLQQGWGELGLDTCAHAAGQEPLPLRIKDHLYSRGLGHHAPGELIIELDGEYAAFEAEVGVQWQQGNTGSVTFQVWVDDELRFDSGVMREQDAPRPVRVALDGAQQLRLVVTDAGDGITCDCANWAEARLVRAVGAPVQPPQPGLDVAPFAWVVTCDPHRSDGCRASRIEEFRAEDVFLETEILPDSNGSYLVPTVADGTGCLGLRWMERRRLRMLALPFAEGIQPPDPDGVRLEYWEGESPWQGGWRPLPATLEVEGQRWLYRVEYRGREHTNLWGRGTWKVRWIFTTSRKRIILRRPQVFTRSRWDTATLWLESARPANGMGEVEVYNGAILEPEAPGDALSRSWELRRPLRLTVRHSRSDYSRSDRTVLRVRLPGTAFGVAVDDVLEHGAVWVPVAGLRVRAGSGKRKAAPSPPPQSSVLSPILDRVRTMPDQTFQQALAKTHRPAQDEGPVMLSLACDNRKWVMQRAGAIEFEGFRLTPHFGSGENAALSRHLHGGWLPAPVVAVEEKGVRYQQLTFVVGDENKAFFPDRLGWLHAHPLCVSEWSLRNPHSQPAQGSLRLEFAREEGQIVLRRVSDRLLVQQETRLLACIDLAEAHEMESLVEGSALLLRGTLAPGRTVRCVGYLPGWAMQAEEHGRLKGSGSLLADLKAYWERVLAPAMQVELPDPFLTHVIRASQVHCLIAARNEAEGERVAAWIASMSYGPLESEAHSVIRGMALMGHQEFARRALDFFVHRYHPAGYLTTGYTLMGTGWHLWTLGEHYRLTRDREWLESIAPEIARVCRWIVAQRAKTMQRDARGEKVPEYGLMPPGVMADWNSFAYYFALNGYYYAGLRWAAEALADIGHPDAPALLEEAEAFRADIERAYRWTQARMPVVPLQDGTWVPGYPSQVFVPGPTADAFPGEDGNRSWAYDVEIGAHQLIPQGVLAADGDDAGWMMNHLEDVHFLSEGWFDYPATQSREDWFNLGGFAKVQPYYCRNGEVYALRDDVKPFIRSYFNALCSLLNTENLSLWEHFRHSGAWNKTHETGYFLQQTRFMLVMERGEELWLAPLVTDQWLRDGLTIAVRQAPTRFGPVSYRITSSVGKGFIEAVIAPPTRTPPAAIVLRLRHPGGRRIQSVTLNGEPWADFDEERETIRIEPGSGEIVAQVFYRGEQQSLGEGRPAATGGPGKPRPSA